MVHNPSGNIRSGYFCFICARVQFNAYLAFFSGKHSLKLVKSPRVDSHSSIRDNRKIVTLFAINGCNVTNVTKYDSSVKWGKRWKARDYIGVNYYYLKMCM